MAEEMKGKINFIENELAQLMSTQATMEGQKILHCTAKAKSQLDGFMSSIFTVQLETEDIHGK